MENWEEPKHSVHHTLRERSLSWTVRLKGYGAQRDLPHSLQTPTLPPMESVSSSLKDHPMVSM